MPTIERAGVDRSTDYTRDELASISLRMVAQDGEPGQGSVPIPSPDGSAEPWAGELFVVSVGATLVSEGFVGAIDRDRGESAAGNRMVDRYTVGDENAVLHGFRAVNWTRPAETTRQRFLAFLDDFVPWVTDTTWVTTDVVRNLKAKKYTTETLFDELFGEIKDKTGNVAFVEGHRGHLHPPTVGIAGGLTFSDVEGEYDYSTSFPVLADPQPRRSRDPLDLRNDIMVKSPTHSAIVTGSVSISQHDSGGLKHQSLILLEEGDQEDVDDKAAAILDDLKFERNSYEFDTGPMTADQLALIPVGCLIDVTSSVLGFATPSTQRIGGMTVRVRHGDRFLVHLELGYPLRKRVLSVRTAPVAAAVEAMQCCPPWDGVGTPDTGEEVSNELQWTGDGTQTADVTAFPYLPGTLRVWVAGLSATGHVTEDDPTTGDYSLDFAPTTGQVVRATYFAA